ncbi:MAG: NAD(P)H-dependent oxidoreductase [Saprospiraceae bacterium]|nr:NAD(P)H-dependent oxidoreductase [Candidatus Brachybacter algidus]
MKELVDDIYRTDGFILLTPEYNGSYTPVLKNLLNHFPKMHRKPCAIVSASDGALGGMRAAQQLQLLIGAHFGLMSPYMMVVPHMHTKFDEDGVLLDPKFQLAIDKFTEEFLWLLKTVTRP